MTDLPALTDARLELDGRVAVLTLERDDVRNALLRLYPELGNA